MRTARRARRATLIGFLAGALFEVDVHATPADVFGIGPRTQATAGTGATWDSGSEAAFVNPAALALTPRSELTIGFHDAVFSLDVEGGRAPGRFSTPASSGVLLGVLVPLRIGQEPIALGLYSRSPADVVAAAHLPYPESPQFPLLANRMQALDLNLALGFAIGPRLSLGAGLRALASLGGTVHIAQEPGGRSLAQIEDELTPAYAPSLGVRFDPGADFSVALVWRAPLRADFDVRIAETDLGAVKLPELNISGVAEYDPAEVHAEVSRQMGAWRIAAAVTYRKWSAFPGWLSATTTCPATKPMCTALGPDVPVLDDTWVPRAGVAYGFEVASSARAEVRAGYFYEASPLAEQTSAANTWDNARHVLTLGYGIDLTAPLFPVRIDAAYQLHALVSRTHRKDATVAADNAGFPQVTTGGSVQSFGLSAGVKF
jgi:long-subunit fatty acid transport protein